MLLLPGCEVFVIVRFGATSIKSSKSRIFCVLSCSDVTATTDAGTSCSLSARLFAVTTISSSGEPASVVAVCPNATAAQQLSAQTATEIRRFDTKPMISPRTSLLRVGFENSCPVMLPVSVKNCQVSALFQGRIYLRFTIYQRCSIGRHERLTPVAIAMDDGGCRGRKRSQLQRPRTGRTRRP